MSRPQNPRTLAHYRKEIGFTLPTHGESERFAGQLSELFGLDKGDLLIGDLVTSTADAIAYVASKSRDAKLRPRAVANSLKPLIVVMSKLSADFQSGKAIKPHRLRERVSAAELRIKLLLRLLPEFSNIAFHLKSLQDLLAPHSAKTESIQLREILRNWTPIVERLHSGQENTPWKNTSRDPMRCAIGLLAMNFMYFGFNISPEKHTKSWENYVRLAFDFGHARGYLGTCNYPDNKVLKRLAGAAPGSTSLHIAL